MQSGSGDDKEKMWRVEETGVREGLSFGRDGRARQQRLEAFCLEFWGKEFSERGMKSHKMSFPERQKKVPWLFWALQA